jgi:valyl-tRNA synthetase/predicted alpha/beta hydrolase family esterase
MKLNLRKSNMSLSPNYNPKDNETQIYTQWINAKIGNPELQKVKATTVSPQKGTKSHAILMPPPNLTGDLHAGHAFQHYLMDTLSRLARQRGEKNLWFPGVDHAGLQLEGVIDKLIKKGEFDEIISKTVTATTMSPQSTFKDLKEINKEDLPKYLKTNYPDLWLKCAWSKVNLWRDNQKNQSAILGDTPDYDRTLFTLDPQNLEMVNYAFQKYWQDGLIYKGSYLVNWSVGLQTALSDVAGEIEYEKRIDPFVTFEYRLVRKIKSKRPIRYPSGVNIPSIHFEMHNKNGTDPYSYPIETYIPISGKSILVSTVRPETIFGDYAVAVHPDVFETEYSEFKDLLKNKELFVEIPLKDKSKESLSGEFDNGNRTFIPVIIASEVDKSFGSGALKITPANDSVDYKIFNDYLGGDFESSIGRDGKLTAICGEFAGQTVNEARANVIKKLIENGFVPKKDKNETERKESKNYFGIEFAENINPEDYQIDWNYEHNVTICERTKTVVEPLISEEFFISYHKEFNWTPIAKDLSRTVTSKGKKTNLQKLGIEAVKATNFHSPEYKERGINFLENIKDWCISRDLIWGHKMPVWYNLDTNPERKFYNFDEINELQNNHFAISVTKPTTPGNWVQEEKILDTWFSSCLWPLSSLKYPEFVKNQTPYQGARGYSNLVLIHGGEVWKDKETYRNKIENGELNWLWYKFNHGSKKTFKTDLINFCQQNNISLLNPQMPNKTNADYTKWKMVFEQAKDYINSETVLVGHSLGSMFLTKYLNENEMNCKAVFLVSGGLWSESENNIEDFDTKWGLDNNFEKLKQLSSKVNIVHSKDDKVVDFQRSLDLKSKLTDANLIEFEDFGHLNVGCPELLELIVSQLQLKNHPFDKEGQSVSFREIQNDFQTFYPTQELVTGKDIFYQWIVRMTVLSYYFTAQIPYQDVVVHPTILDDKGKKMSKALGNGMDPVAQINKYSSDAMRMAMLGGMIPDRNIKMGGRLADELCEKYRNFGNKMWNVARFFEYQQEKKAK